MSEIHLQASSLSTSESSDRVHFLPCHVDYDGSAKVAEYFDSVTTKEGNGKFMNFFPIWLIFYFRPYIELHLYSNTTDTVSNIF